MRMRGAGVVGLGVGISISVCILHGVVCSVNRGKGKGDVNGELRLRDIGAGAPRGEGDMRV